MGLPQQHQKSQNAFDLKTSLSRTWPVKMLGLLLAFAAVLLLSEILSVLLNLPEDTARGS
jgi:hypothetical protein